MSGECDDCPFCGSSNTNLTPSLLSADYVECQDCWAHGPIIGSYINVKQENRKLAIKKWNERV